MLPTSIFSIDHGDWNQNATLAFCIDESVCLAGISVCPLEWPRPLRYHWFVHTHTLHPLIHRVVIIIHEITGPF